MDIKQIDKQYIANTYNRADIVIDHANGALLYDTDGREYIDLCGGIAVNIFGYNDEVWKKAVINQLGKVQHTSNLYYTQPQAELAQLLCERTGFKKVFFSNSGAEANECAIKCARKYSSDKYGEGRNIIITLKNSFHGRTITTLSATGQADFHKHFGPFTPGFMHVSASDISELKDALQKEQGVCAVMIELIQGEGGLNVLDIDFVSAVSELCKNKDILLIVDEVQSGNGRTGKLYCYEHYGIMPDIITTAKGLGGGLPIGATLLGEKVKDVLTYGTHGSTFGGNPVAAAGALSIIKRIDDALLQSVLKKGEYVKSQLKNVTGLGLMLGVTTKKPVAEVINECRAKGVIVLSAKDKVRLLPPLNITEAQLEKAISVLKGVIEN